MCTVDVHSSIWPYAKAFCVFNNFCFVFCTLFSTYPVFSFCFSFLFFCILASIFHANAISRQVGIINSIYPYKIIISLLDDVTPRLCRPLPTTHVDKSKEESSHYLGIDDLRAL